MPTVETWKRCARRAEHGLAGLGALTLVYALGFDLSYMSSPSMSPTLQSTEGNPDWVLTQKVTSWGRWDVVTFRDREGMQLMKRVVGLPGEAVSLPDLGRLCIDGRELPLPEHLSFLRYLPAGNLAKGRSFPAGDGWYVLGDEVRDSLDSRFEGAVTKDRIVGRAWLRVWPPSRIGLIR